MTFAGCPNCSPSLPTLDVEGKRKRTKLLWEALKEVDQRLRAGAFIWLLLVDVLPTSLRDVRRCVRSTAQHDCLGARRRRRTTTARVRRLRIAGLGREPGSHVQDPIQAADHRSARARGRIEPKVLEMLKKRGLTSVAELLAALGEEEQSEPTGPAPTPSEGTDAPGNDSPGTVEDALKNDPRELTAPDAADS